VNLRGSLNQDLAWVAGKAESQATTERRITTFLEQIYEQPEYFISVTSHGSITRAFLKVVGHPNPKFNITPGQIIPAIVRMEKMTKSKQELEVPGFSTLKKCDICGPKT
jgi:broad specificity phosphatase PhoE